jgi:hypothetical protein
MQSVAWPSQPGNPRNPLYPYSVGWLDWQNSFLSTVDGFEEVVGPWCRFGDCVAFIPPGRTEGASAGAQASPEPLLSCGIFWSGRYLQEEQCFTRTRLCASPNSRPMRGTCS